MGTTIGCAQCHNHKYDPFSQKEYYQLYAVFNNTEDRNSGDDFPTLTTPLAGREAEAADLAGRLVELHKKLDPEVKNADFAFVAWEKTVDRKLLPKKIADLLAVPAAKRKTAQRLAILAYHRSLNPRLEGARS